MRRIHLLPVLAAACTLILIQVSIADVPRTMNYQGRLTDSEETSVADSSYTVTFSLYTEASGGSAEWSSGPQSVTMTDGFFTYLLGANISFVDDLFKNNAELWLGIKVDPDLDEIDPRSKLTSTPYTYHSLQSDTAGYAWTIADDSVTTSKIAENAVTSAEILDGTIDFVDVAQNGAVAEQVMKWNGIGWVVANDSIAQGSGWVDDGTIVRLETSDDSVGIGSANPTEKLHVEGNLQITGKANIGPNSNLGDYSFAAGYGNTSSGSYSVVSGGMGNYSSNMYSSIGGGGNNQANEIYTHIGGGLDNRVDDNYSVIAGGRNNYVGAGYAAIAGGQDNYVVGLACNIGGGIANHIEVAGGGYSSILGGRWNSIVSTGSVGGAAIIGGGENSITGSWSTICGGTKNTVNGAVSAICGSDRSAVNAMHASVFGGFADTIVETGNYSTLIGINSTLTEDSTFMVDMPHIRFGDETDGYEVPVEDGTAGQVMSTNGGGLVSWVDPTSGSSGWADDGSVVRLETSDDSVGIGTLAPTEKLHVEGNILVIGKANIGSGNSNSGEFSFVAGYGNIASGDSSSVAGGARNEASGVFSAVGGGESNGARGYASSVGGGYNNSADTSYSSVGGGQHNRASDPFSSVGGGYNNIASGNRASVSGGDSNGSSGWASSVGGGSHNIADTSYASVCGGSYNRADNSYASVGGGNGNNASGNSASVGGGNGNHASSFASSVAGGYSNAANNSYSSVVGGRGNVADSSYASVGGGWVNKASGEGSRVGGGRLNGAIGAYSTVPGGHSDSANGRFSFAAGRRAKAIHDGTFVWADTTNTDFESQRVNQFRVRANGGVRLDINNSGWIEFYDNATDVITTSTGAHLTIGGIWTNNSDRNAKENFMSVDRQELLEKIADLDITRWNYKVENDVVTHIGPMAQDFHAAFRVGNDNKSIATLDEAGVALAAIQELHSVNQDLEKRIEELEMLVEKLLRENQ